MMPKYKAALLAGGRSPWLTSCCGTDIRLLAPVGSGLVLDYMLQALRSCERIESIVVVADSEALAQLQPLLPHDVACCEAGSDMPTTCLNAVYALELEPEEKLLFICDDIPLLTPEALDDFLQRCEEQPEGQCYYPIIAQQDCLAAYPEAQRTYGRIAEGAFTGGNLFLAQAGIIISGQDMAHQLFARRKSPFKLACWLGWTFILKVLLGRLTLAGAQQRCEELLQFKCRVIITPYPEVGMDMDKDADLRLIDQYLANKNLTSEVESNG